MPIYNYGCIDCDHQEDVVVPVIDRDNFRICPKCGSKLCRDRAPSRPIIRLGKGFWAHNDYTYQAQKELDAALKENEGHMRMQDKRTEIEMREGLY